MSFFFLAHPVYAAFVNRIIHKIMCSNALFIQQNDIGITHNV